MDDEKRVGAFIDLYKQQMQRFGQTQAVEWKANFGVWTLLAGAIYLAVHENNLNLPRCLTAITLLLTVGVHLVFLIKIHQSESFDKKLWARYREEALMLLRSSGAVHEDEKRSGREPGTELVWLFLEVGISALLCIVLYIALFAGRLATPH